MIIRFILTLTLNIRKKRTLYQKKLVIGTEHHINIRTHCSAVWTSERRPAFVAFGPLQRRSNVFEGFLFSCHRLIGWVFVRINRRDLLRIRDVHVVHVFDVCDDVWEAERQLRRTTTLVMNSVELLSLLRPHYCSLRLFLLLLFVNLLELIVRAKQADLPPFSLLRNGLWTLLQQVNGLSLMVWTEKMRVFNEWSVE